MAISAVLFDLGETLWHFPDGLPPVATIREETVRRLSALLRSWGIEPEGELRFLGRDIRLAIGEADRRTYEGDLVSPHYPTLVHEVAVSKGLDITPEQGEQLWETWNLGGAFLGRRLFDDAVETLAALQRQGYRLGSVTNRTFGGLGFMAEVRELGLASFLDIIAISCEVGYMKPHPRIFRHALEKLGVDPQETAMVGDSLRADVGGAQALGMTAVWYRRPESLEQVDGVRPDFVVDRLREIPQLPCFDPRGGPSRH